MRGKGLLLCALLLAACTDKRGASSADAGEAAVLAKAQDGGALDAGATAEAEDAGALDTAMPGPPGDELSNRMKHLLEAISQNDADLASDALFPRDAYAATKDLPDPAKAWEKRVQGVFKRHVGTIHKRVKGIDGAKFVSFELGRSIAQVTPKKKGFKKPLWRVRHSKLTFSLDGKTRHLDITEMTAWRGAWYVTELR
jgi:hypothetical protein